MRFYFKNITDYFIDTIILSFTLFEFVNYVLKLAREEIFIRLISHETPSETILHGAIVCNLHLDEFLHHPIWR